VSAGTGIGPTRLLLAAERQQRNRVNRGPFASSSSVLTLCGRSRSVGARKEHDPVLEWLARGREHGRDPRAMPGGPARESRRAGEGGVLDN